jgi:hypothetical protein
MHTDPWPSIIVAVGGLIPTLTASIIAIIKAVRSERKANLIAEDSMTIGRATPGINESKLNSHSIVQEIHDMQIAKLKGSDHAESGS